MRKSIWALLILFFAGNMQAQTIKAISPAVFSDSLQTQQNFVLLDVRTPQEFKDGHLKNAINIDLNHTDFKNKLGLLDANKTFYVYCRSGKRSAAAAHKMKTLGFHTIYELDGGMLKWVEAGMQTVTEVK